MNPWQKVIYDISLMIPDESVLNPGDPPYRRTLKLSLDGGDAYDVSGLEISAHFGTHLDCPSHFNKSGKSLNDYKPGDFILPAVVASFEDKESIKPYELETVSLEPGEALLCKTHNSVSGLAASGIYQDDFVYVSAEASQLCVRKQVGLLGIDYASVDRYDNDALHAHRILLGNSIVILEGINLKDVPPGRYTLVCLPLRIKDGEASPVRAVLLE